MTGLRPWSRNYDTFSVGVPQFEMTGLPGTFLGHIWINSNRYRFPKLVAFLYSKEKNVSSFSFSLYIYIYINPNLPQNIIVRLYHPLSGESQGQEAFC